MRAPKKEIIEQKKLDVKKEHLRFSTPYVAAEYRAERLKCNTLVEIGCSIGAQTIAFAKACKKVIGVDINLGLIATAKENIKRLEIKNVEFIEGDCLNPDVIKQIKKLKPDIIFLDTERKAEGKRSLDDLKPDVWKFIEEYSKISNKIAIEVSPYTNDLGRLKENFEKEFISIDKKLNRLTLYLNKLKKSDRSAVSLPSITRLENKNVKSAELADSASSSSYLYVIDPAIPMAELINELADELKYRAKIIEFNGRNYFLSKELLNSSFIEAYKILSVTENKFESILDELKKIDAKSVVIRYSIDPKEYWKERKNYESKLSGTRKVHLFANKEAILCESLAY